MSCSHGFIHRLFNKYGIEHPLLEGLVLGADVGTRSQAWNPLLTPAWPSALSNSPSPFPPPSSPAPQGVLWVGEGKCSAPTILSAPTGKPLCWGALGGPPPPSLDTPNQGAIGLHLFPFFFKPWFNVHLFLTWGTCSVKISYWISDTH